MLAFYLVPFVRAMNRRGYARYCAMDEHTPEIVAARGAWNESEIDNNLSVVCVSAPRSLALPFPTLSETEARRATIMPRFRERYISSEDRIVFDGPSIVPLSVESLVLRSTQETTSSRELRTLIGAWLALGFGLGWRVPHWFAVWAAIHLGEPTRLTAECARLFFAQHGAFPTTSTLDNFNRANENPIGGNWTNDIFGGDGNIELNTNQIKGASAAWCSAYWNAATFGPDSEAYITMSTEGTGSGTEIACRIIEPNTANVDNYFTHYTPGTTTFQLWRTVNTTQTQLGATAVQAMADGDSFGIEAIGTTIQGYYKASAGSWGSVLSRTDSNVTGAGRVGIVINNTSARGDNFGGGTVVSASGARVPYMVGQGGRL